MPSPGSTPVRMRGPEWHMEDYARELQRVEAELATETQRGEFRDATYKAISAFADQWHGLAKQAIGALEERTKERDAAEERVRKLVEAATRFVFICDTDPTDWPDGEDDATAYSALRTTLASWRGMEGTK